MPTLRPWTRKGPVRRTRWPPVSPGPCSRRGWPETFLVRRSGHALAPANHPAEAAAPRCGIPRGPLDREHFASHHDEVASILIRILLDLRKGDAAVNLFLKFLGNDVSDARGEQQRLRRENDGHEDPEHHLGLPSVYRRL